MLLAAVLVAPYPSAADDGAAFEPVVPPGQDALLAAMFGSGALLPGNCAFVDGKADGPFVRATYDCQSGPVVLLLGHPSKAGPGTLVTQRFTIALGSGAPPDALVASVVSLIRAREAAFQWASPDDGAEDAQAY